LKNGKYFRNFNNIFRYQLLFSCKFINIFPKLLTTLSIPWGVLTKFCHHDCFYNERKTSEKGHKEIIPANMLESYEFNYNSRLTKDFSSQKLFTWKFSFEKTSNIAFEHIMMCKTSLWNIFFLIFCLYLSHSRWFFQGAMKKYYNSNWKM
jgi:hypothetical protein